jgi:diguanylate cyclase (GGDEF)-like protein
MEAAKKKMVSYKKHTEYRNILTQYLKERNEDCLYQLYELSKVLLNEGASLQDIFSLHIESLKKILTEGSLLLQPAVVLQAFEVFLEIMSPYEMAFGHYIELKRLNLLQEVGIKLISFLDMDSLCQFIIDKSTEILKMEKGCLYLKNGATGELTLRAVKSTRTKDLRRAAKGNFPVCIPLKTGDKLVGEIRFAGTPTLDEMGKQIILILTNQFALAIERLMLYKTLREQSITDGLTGVFNMRYFYETLRKEINRVRRYHQMLSLVIIDIDNLKKINDSYGHLAGDVVIKDIANFLKEIVRETDVVARYGGDEFVILMPETDNKQALNTAVRILDKVRGYRFKVGAGCLRVTLSAGAADYSKKDMGESDLVKMADEALYLAKAEGKDRVCLYK